MTLRWSFAMGCLVLACGSEAGSPVDNRSAASGPEPSGTPEPSASPSDGGSRMGIGPAAADDDDEGDDVPSDGGSTMGGEVVAPDEPRPLPADNGDFEFIPWEALTNTGMGAELVPPLVIRSVSRSSSYDTEHLLVAVATDTGSNRIVAVDAVNKTFRDHWTLECGDCIASADWATSVIADGAVLYATQDFGYRYFRVAEADFGEGGAITSVHVFGDTIWAQGAWGWATAPVDANGALTMLDWPESVAGVGVQGAVAVDTDRVLQFGPEGTPSARNPCPVPLPSYSLWMARDESGQVDVACANNQLARTEDFVNAPFSVFDLDSPVVWVGEFFIVTEHSWYDDVSLERFGYQGPLQEGERVFGYSDHTRVGLRVSNLGIARSILVQPIGED